MNPMTNDPYARHAGPPPIQPNYHRSLRAVPAALWVGLVIGVVAFAVKITSLEISSGDSGYSCSYTNYAGFLAAAAIGVCLISGWVGRAKTHPRGRLALPLMSAISLLLVVLAVVHVLRGQGTIGNPCDSHPLP